MIQDHVFSWRCVVRLPRKRNTELVEISDAHPVEVREISGGVAPVVCSVVGLDTPIGLVERNDKPVVFRKFGDGFYRTVHERTGSPALDAAEAVARRHGEGFKLNYDAVKAWPNRFMSRADFDKLPVAERISNDRDEALKELARAQGSDEAPAFVLIDGAPFERCPEPVLMQEHRGVEPVLRVISRPRWDEPRLGALFRLDEMEEAILFLEREHYGRMEADCKKLSRRAVTSIERPDLLEFNGADVMLAREASALVSRCTSELFLRQASPAALVAYAELRDIIVGDPTDKACEVAIRCEALAAALRSGDHSHFTYRDIVSEVETWRRRTGAVGQDQDQAALGAAMG